MPPIPPMPLSAANGFAPAVIVAAGGAELAVLVGVADGAAALADDEVDSSFGSSFLFFTTK